MYCNQHEHFTYKSFSLPQPRFKKNHMIKSIYSYQNWLANM